MPQPWEMDWSNWKGSGQPNPAKPWEMDWSDPNNPTPQSQPQEMSAKEKVPTVSPGEDIIRSIVSQPRKVAEGLAGLPGNLREMVSSGMDWATGKPLADIYAQKGIQPPPNIIPSSSDIQAQTSKFLGPSYEPQYPAGKYAGAITGGVLGASLGGGGIMSKLGIGAGAGAGGEALPDLLNGVKGTRLEAPARILGSLAGGLGAILTGKGVTGVRNIAAGQETGRAIGNITGGPPLPASSVKYLSQDVEANRLTPQGAQQTANRIGPEAVLGDVGEQLQNTMARDLTRIPGQAGADVSSYLQSRTGAQQPTGGYMPGVASGQRLNATFDAAMGTKPNAVNQAGEPVHDIVKLKNDIHQQFGPQVKQAYNDVMSSHPNVMDNDLVSLLNRPAIADSFRGAGKLAANYGDQIAIDQSGNMVGAPGLKEWDYVKRGLDQKINQYYKSGGDITGKDAADLNGLMKARRDLVNHLDTMTTDPKTGVSGYKMARTLSSTEHGLNDAMDFHKQFFNNTVYPEVLKDNFSNLSLPEQAVAKFSIRRELANRAGGVGNDANKMESIFTPANVIDKTKTIFGNDAGNVIDNAINSEKRMQEATNLASRGRQSITSGAQAGMERLNPPSPVDLNKPLGAYISGPIEKAKSYVENAMFGPERTHAGIAQAVLTPNQGTKIQDLVQALKDYQSGVAARNVTMPGQHAGALARSLLARQLGGQ